MLKIGWSTVGGGSSTAGWCDVAQEFQPKSDVGMKAIDVEAGIKYLIEVLLFGAVVFGVTAVYQSEQIAVK